MAILGIPCRYGLLCNIFLAWLQVPSSSTNAGTLSGSHGRSRRPSKSVASPCGTSR